MEIKEWVEAGELPFLSRMAKEGVFGRLESVIPPFTMLAWPVIFTGKNPAKIGSFLYKGEKKGYDPEFFSNPQFINSTDIKTWSIWEWVSQFGGKVGVMNIPMTYPPKEVNGFLITGSLTPKGAKNFSYPPELKDELKGYRIDLELSEGLGTADRTFNKEKLHYEFVELLKDRTEWALRLLNKYDPDLYMVNFKEIDDFMHFFWDRKDLMLEFFKKADRTLEKVYNLLKPDNIMVISDHGFTEAPIKYFYANQYLENKGFLIRDKNIKGRFSNFIYKAGVEVVKRFGIVRNLIPDGFKVKIVRKSIKEKINWDMTRAYAHWYAGVYLNPKYYSNEESKKRGAEEIKKLFLNAKDPENGKKVFLVVKTKWELFKGPYFDEMPEVVYTTTKDYRLDINIPNKLVEERIDRPSLVGHHTSALDGILFIWGEGVKGGVNVEGCIQDVFPTACALSNLPIPEDVDGKILKEALIEGLYRKEFKDLPYPEKESRFLSEKEDQSVKEHLKDLGYI